MSGSKSASAPPAESGQLLGPAGGNDLHVMSFNIRYDPGGSLPGQADYWPEREPLITRLFEVEGPTILGVQEAMFHQLPSIENGLSEHHRAVGFGRNGGSQGEQSAIYYDSRRLTVQRWDQFWLSDTPQVIGSRTWGNTVPRIVTWGLFADNNSGKDLVIVNTHLDHRSEPSRVRGAGAIVSLMDTFETNVPTLLTGDFNSIAGKSSAYSTLVGSGVFQDTWATARKRLTPAYGTFANFKEPVEGASRIDWVLATPEIHVLKTALNTFRVDGRYPSDHLPVQALVRLP
jgi:endonuclease/exonuclease/phosphatase family metal-dependent hydrolase